MRRTTADAGCGASHVTRHGDETQNATV